MAKDIHTLEFEPCKEAWRDGYLIVVRNRLNNMLQNEFLPEEMKEDYIKDWGYNILYDDQFVDWYCKLKKKEYLR